MLRNVFRPHREEDPGAWRKLHNEELCRIGLLLKKYESGDQMKDEMDGSCSMYG